MPSEFQLADAYLFPESRISSSDFNIAFMSLVHRHNLTYSSQTDILRLLSMVLPTPNTTPSSASALLSKFADFKTEAVVQKFCDCCTSLLDADSSSCVKPSCVSVRAQHAVFVRVPLAMQLKDHFQGMYLYSLPIMFLETQNNGLVE